MSLGTHADNLFSAPKGYTAVENETYENPDSFKRLQNKL